MDFKNKILIKFSDFFFFYSYIGNKVFVALFLSFTVGLMDGLGLAMFVPLLQMVDGSSEFQANQSNVGNMVFFIDALNSIGLSMNLVTVLSLILIFFSLKGIFRFSESYFNVVLTTDFAKKVRKEGVDAISNLNFKYFVQLDSGKIQNTLSSEIVRLRMAFTSYSASIQAFMSVIVYISLAFVTNPQFAILVVIGGLFSNFLYTKLYKKTKETSKKITLSNSVFHGLMIQQIQNFKYLRATGKIELYKRKIKKSIDQVDQAFKKIGFFNSILSATKEPLSIAVVVVVILIQTQFYSTELGPIILALLFFYRSLNQVIVFQNHWNNFMNNSGAVENHRTFILNLNENRIDYNKGVLVKKIEKIDFEDVSFSYVDRPILKNINLSINQKQTVAFVGPSGSGKTTISNLIAGLLPIDSGWFKINGIEFNELNLNQYQSLIGYITQEPVIFNDSIYNNITMWADKNEGNIKKFNDCIERAHLTEFFASIEFNEDHILGNNGVLISGGQKQRIAIARELFKDVELFILDEATSALDSETEKEIQSYFDNLRGNYTIIVIAHRLSTIRNADLIYLMKDGKIIGSGDFNTLQEISPEFKKMVSLQDFSFVE
ncbi:ABC transporter ATP-binding protein [Cognataquiflexum rubidum]|uniref:ABC transporter ATP-binding protein n=1 Tax=Cognataquiflexum rubidum TaxID=2922273 RepID=UPI001F13D8C7|nr:ABC transporter ATP-binding protein [Cognataquiflexum rubidum]MCH6236482.1 ABC transporter ATP-binding protein/permease [Cognataquiflexum rubidum]